MSRPRDEVQKDLTAAEEQLQQAKDRVNALRTELGDPQPQKGGGTGAGLPTSTKKPVIE
jgi:hypothetical protein